MEKIWIFLIVLLVFLTFIFLFWKLTRSYATKDYSSKIWKHWPTRLSYWQAAIFYSIGFTLVTVFILKWANVLTF